MMVDAVVTRACAVDADEAHRRIGRQQYVMPGAEVIIDALFAVSDEGSQLSEVGVVGCRTDDDDEGTRIERQESLAAERVVFEMVDPARHVELVTGHQADNRARLLTFELYPGKFVIAVRHAVVDRE